MDKSILRIPTDFGLNDKLVGSLTKILSANMDILTYSEEPDFYHSYQTRMKSIRESFQFLCEACPPASPPTSNDQELQEYLQWSEFEASKLAKNQPIETYQEQLIRYSTVLVHAFINLQAWNPRNDTKLETAALWLDKAEQYLILQKPRPIFATLTYLDPDKQQLVLVVDKPLNPFTAKTINELTLIKQQSMDMSLHGKRPSLPGWFTTLDDIDQRLLQLSLQRIDLENPATIVFLSSRLRTIPGLANFAEHQMYLFSADGNLIKTFDPRYRSSHIGSRDVMRFSAEIQRRHTEDNAQRLQESITQLQNPAQPPRPLLLQTLISPINAPMKRVQAITPDYYLDQQRHHAKNFLQKHQQSTYTTNHPLNLARAITYTEAESPECLAIVTAARSMLAAANREAQATDEHQALASLVSDYQKTLNSGNGTAFLLDWNGRELFLSSLEQLIIVFMHGVSYGSCVSGKDRKAIELIHTNAMLLYYEQYQKWPRYTDQGLARQNFVNLVVKLYHTRHYQLFSGQNAPGSDGIKTPQGYLPKDISSTINTTSPGTSPLTTPPESPLDSSPISTVTDPLTADDRLASNNDVEALVSLTYASYLLAAKCLCLEQQQKLLDSIQRIVSKREFWQGRAAGLSGWLSFFAPADEVPSMPQGITQLHELFSQQAIPPNAMRAAMIKQLADIYLIVDHRSHRLSAFRHSRTQDLYSELQRLFQEDGPEKVIGQVMMQLETFIVDNRMSKEFHPPEQISPKAQTMISRVE